MLITVQQLSEIEQNWWNARMNLISWLKNYRGGPGLAARELVWDEEAEPEDNHWWLFFERNSRHIPWCCIGAYLMYLQNPYLEPSFVNPIERSDF